MTHHGAQDALDEFIEWEIVVDVLDSLLGSQRQELAPMRCLNEREENYFPAQHVSVLHRSERLGTAGMGALERLQLLVVTPSRRTQRLDRWADRKMTPSKTRARATPDTVHRPHSRLHRRHADADIQRERLRVHGKSHQHRSKRLRAHGEPLRRRRLRATA